MSFSAFSAKVVGSDAPSSVITSSCLPSTPPAALISSTAIASESLTVFSLMAMVPDSEFRKPILTESPLVSTQLAAPVAAAAPEPLAAEVLLDEAVSTLDPQALSSRPAVNTTAMPPVRRRIFCVAGEVNSLTLSVW